MYPISATQDIQTINIAFRINFLLLIEGDIQGKQAGKWKYCDWKIEVIRIINYIVM